MTPKRSPTEAALPISLLPAHGQFTTNDVRPPNNPAAKVLFPLGGQNGVKRDAENDRSHVRTGGCRLGSANGGVRSRRRGRLPRQLRRRLRGMGRRLPPGSASRHDAPRLANSASTGLQLIEDTSQRVHIAGLVELGPKAKSK